MIENIFKSSENKESTGNYFRTKRSDFLHRIKSMKKHISILDLEGKLIFGQTEGLQEKVILKYLF